MTNCDPATLVENARCIESCTTPGQREAITVWLLAQIAGVPADPQTLLTNAQCLLGCLTAGQMEAIRVWLACQIAP